jgi:glycosyltransferase involved in cell wall biosynthesis
MTRIAAVLVTSNSERWIELTLASVVGQSRRPDEIVVIDDGSTDSTAEIVERVLGGRARLVASTAGSTDRSTRIAHNFRQGLQQVRDCDIAVLGDHDDVWHPNRIGNQVGVLEVWQHDTMLASNGRLVDESGLPVGGSLRTAFPVPVDWSGASPAERMRAVLRYSVATGGASAIRPAAFADVPIPAGWLHDRWWSLVAAAREQLRLDDEVVIDYRVSADQEVGLDRGQQGRSGVQRAAAGVASLPTTISRMGDLRRLSSSATEATRAELSYPRLLQTLLQG